ncbi:Fanconi anaemia protein FancD2 nuclease-domain-containing protein [Gilbertella persicaria]|uniref:Fanconi anaemia protein FancD2 nuclease-domain-containing protein n=1 Tax=Gilbertella persicaria TaxID=101096 RepID=UPI00221EE307|nr:Fanconi anaemia protein FancD2 nuclease-domain-containing protein [Gilbertella persicaria]KAI8054182.1 Fanconi anaemia protein FancD2 nuclease-domain-containing protein [Gilbertella persicaria]
MAPMCSIFNLIQSCEQQLNQGSLVEVDALFGCSVILFKIDDIEDLSTEEVEYACDMLFYTINWFRELLNAFMFTKEEENYRTRLISRLRNVLEMEQLLSQLMQQLANYVPLEFQQTSSAAFEDSSQITRNEESQETSAKPAKKTAKTSIMKISSVNELRPYMRAFHIHLLEILKYNEELEEDRMTFEEINYVLEDIKQKLDIKVVPPPVTAFGKKKSTEDNIKYPSCNSIMLARMDAQKLMQKVVAYLPDILQTLENLYSEIQTKDIEPGRIEGSEDLVLAVSHILNILNKLISWPDIQNSDNQEILQNIIRSIADRISGDSKQKKNSTTQDEDLQQAFRYLSQFGNSIPQSTTAVLLFKILQRLMTFSGQASANLKRDALGVVKQIISTGWFDWRDIRKDIQFLFEQYIELSKNPLEVLHDIVNRVLPAFEEEQSLKEYPLLREDTLINHYQAVINQTVKAFDMLKDTDQEAEVVLLQTSQIVKAFERITNYVKTKENKSLLGILLKTSRTYIEQFTKHSIPYFTGIFKAHSNSVLAIFKDFQTTTRMLQIICSHVKVQKEVQLSSYVPPLKKALEIVIYQVKMLLTENRIPSSAFFMGALKHRDMRGAEISSQIPREPSDNEEEQEQEEVEEEEEGEEMNTNSEETTRQNSPATTNSSNKATSARRVYKPEPKNRASPGNSALAQSYRTSSVVPSSSEEEDEGQEDEEEQEDDDDDDDDLPRQSSNSKKRKAQEDLDEIVIDFNNKSSDDHDDEDSPPPNLSRNTKHQQSQNLAKRKRLGVGRYSASLKHL